MPEAGWINLNGSFLVLDVNHNLKQQTGNTNVYNESETCSGTILS